MGAVLLSPFYILLNIYLFFRISTWFATLSPLLAGYPFFVPFLVCGTLFSLTPLFGTFGRGRFRTVTKRISNYWLGVLMYALIFLIIADLGRLIDWLANGKQASSFSTPVWRIIGAAIIGATAAVTLYGIRHASCIKTVCYDVAIHKQCSHPPIRIALIADLHLGWNAGVRHMQKVCAAINRMKPDLIVFAGDIFDNEFDSIERPDEIAAMIRSVRSTYGSYACWGNHDVEELIFAGFTFKSGKVAPERSGEMPASDDSFRSAGMPATQNSGSVSSAGMSATQNSDSAKSTGMQATQNGSSVRSAGVSVPQDTDIQNRSKAGNLQMCRFLEKAGIRLLEDETVLIGDAFYLSGRLDASSKEKSGIVRLTPDELTSGLDHTKPILVIDHQPSELRELSGAGVDLALSGHTHDGQLFPGNLTTRIGWMNSRGKLVLGNMTSIVTSGAGVWGPAMRVGTDSEVVEITVQFDAS